MKLKKNLKSKSFIASSLAVLCVGFLVVCFVLPKDEEAEFVPEPTATATPQESWTEKPSPTESEKETSVSKNTATNIPKAEEYPKTVESDESKTVVEFTDPSPKKPEAPPVPEGKTEVANPSPSHPVKKDPTVTPSKQPPKEEVKQESKPESSTPAPGSKNDKGQVYDPVFGWVTPSKVEQEIIDGDGDPNKMVGEMN